MAKVLARGGRVLRRGNRLAIDSGACVAACCDGSGNCCTSDCIFGASVGEVHNCGKPDVVRAFCCTEFNIRLHGKTAFRVFSAPTDPDYQTGIVDAVYTQNGPAYIQGTAGCNNDPLIPVRRLWTGRDGTGTYAGTEEFCVPAFLGCWPLTEQHVHDSLALRPCDAAYWCRQLFGQDGVGPFWDFLLAVGARHNNNGGRIGAGPGDFTDPIDGDRYHHEWHWTGTNVEFRMQGGMFFQPGPGSDEVPETLEYSFTFRQSWLTNCDGTPGPTACTPAPPPNCVPSPGTYILGAACPGAPPGTRPFAIPRENVQACGLASSGQWCFRFDPNGRRITNPFALNAIVSNRVIDATSDQDCCNCLSEHHAGPCTVVRIIGEDRPDWTGGGITRDPNTGAITGFVTSPNTSFAKCCCNDADQFVLTRGIQRHVSSYCQNTGTPDPLTGVIIGTEEQWQESEMVPCTTQGPPGVPSVTGGFRRDATQIRYCIRRRQSVRACPSGSPSTPFDQTTESGVDGPVGCEWRAFGGATAANINFDRPHHVGGMEVIDVASAAVPIELVNESPPGQRNGWYCIRYTVFANCTSFISEAEWHLYEPDLRTVRSRLTSRMEWAKAADPASPCTPGCLVSPIINPIPFGLPSPGGGVLDIRNLIGGP